MEYSEVKYQQFDQVRLLTTRNIKYLSAPPDMVNPSPKGIWSVAAVIEQENRQDLLVVRNNVTIRVPATDVLKIAAYDLAAITASLGNFRYGKREAGQGEGQEPG